MKLYAKVTSERASKGQGGNEYLETIFLNDKKEKIASIMIENHNGLLALSYFIDSEKIVSIGKITKGKKQKGECQHKWQKMNNDCYWCKNCEATKDSSGGIID